MLKFKYSFAALLVLTFSGLALAAVSPDEPHSSART